MDHEKIYTLLSHYSKFYGSELYAQQSQIKRADKKYDSYAYIDVIQTYEKVALRDTSRKICLKNWELLLFQFQF